MNRIRPEIRFRLVAGFFLFAFFPLVSLGVFLFDSGKKNIVKQGRERVLTQAILMKEHAGKLLAGLEGVMLSIAKLPDIKRAAARISDSQAAEEDGLWASTGRSLGTFADSMGIISALFLLNPETGEVMASNDIMQVGKFFNKKPYFTSGLDKFSIYRAHYSTSAEKSIIAMSAPITTSNRFGTQAVLVAWVSLDELRSSMSALEGVNAYLVNRSNLYVTGCGNNEGLPIVTGDFSEPAIRGLDGQTGSGVFIDTAGERTVAAYTRIDSLDLALIVKEPVEDVLEGISNDGVRALIISLLIASMVIVVTILSGRRLSYRLLSIRDSATKIASGRSAERFQASSSDDIGLVGESLNLMAESLEKREQEYTDLIMTLNTLIEHIPEGIALLGPQRKVILANNSFESHMSLMGGFGHGSIDTIADEPFEKFLVSAGSLKWRNVKVSAAEGATSREFEVAARQIATESEETFTGFVLAIKELTEEKRIRELAQSQDKMAAMGQLASGIAHDFNNLLTSIIGFSELLMDDPRMPRELSPQLEAINHSGSRAAELVSQILDFSRSSISEPQVLELKGAVAGFIRFITRLLPDTIKLGISGEPGPLNVKIDPTKLQQVLTNLTLNARDAMGGSGEVSFNFSRLRMREGRPEELPGMSQGSWIVLSVTDNGEGIPQETLAHIFEPFYTTKGPSKGTGLGLAQAYGIVNHHGGYITAQSEPGNTEFRVYLPEAHEEMSAQKAEPDIKAQEVRGEGRTVLVVEDDPMIMDLMRAAFASRGFNVLNARSGPEGLEVFSENPDGMDLVLSNMLMPGMNGYEMSLKIRDIRPDIKIIAVSGYSPSAVTGLTEEELHSAGIVKWIPKPFEPSRLIAEAYSVMEED